MATLTREWRLISEEPRAGPMQMALDEVAAETVSEGGPATVRVYGWDQSCLTIGYSQDPTTVDWEACVDAGIDVTRRRTGGGGIYHDADGDVAYAVVVPAEAVASELREAYRTLCAPLLAAFKALGVDADYSDTPRPALYRPACYLREQHPAHDLVVDGRKIAGNAQYRTDDVVVQHGSVLCAIDPEAHLKGFDEPPVTPAAVRERVISVTDIVPVSRRAVRKHLESAFLEWIDTHGGTVNRQGSWTDAELARARELVRERYRDAEWVRGRPGERT